MKTYYEPFPPGLHCIAWIEIDGDRFINTNCVPSSDTVNVYRGTEFIRTERIDVEGTRIT